MLKFKYLIAAGLLMAGTIKALGAEDPKSLLITHTDGSCMSVSLTNNLVLGVDSENIRVCDTSSALSLSIPRSNFASFALSTEEAGVTAVSDDNVSTGVVVGIGGVMLSNLPAGSLVMVYDAKGALVYNCKCTSDTLLISPAELPSGVAVVVVNSFTFKVAMP